MAPTIAIVVPTYNRPEELERAVASIEAVRPASTRVIVVDQSTGQASDRNAAALAGRPMLTYLRSAPPGLPRARNVGIFACDADIVLFMDDDALMMPGCVEEHLVCHRRGDVAVVGGRIRQRGSLQWASVSTPARIDEHTGEGTGNFDLDYEGAVPYVSGGNLSVKRSAISVAGPFNPRFRGNALFEEVELCCRMRKCGYTVWYGPNAVVEHHPAGHGGCGDDNQTRYLLDRMHNHALFYFLQVRRLPTRAFVRSMRNLAEFISRTPGGGGHSALRLSACLRALAEGYMDGVVSILDRHGRRRM